MPDRPARPVPPRDLVGLAVAVAAVTAVTVSLYGLREIAPVVSLGVVYLLAVLVVATSFRSWLAVATAVASALAFNLFHLPPTGSLTLADDGNWIALVVLVVVAIVASGLSERLRQRSRESAERRREADLSAGLARLLLRGRSLADELPTVAHRIATALDLPSAALELRPVDGDERRVAFALREGPEQIGTLLVPADTPEPTLRRVQERVAPSLEALLAAARERDVLLADVVETRALRRSDVLKTALLRAVSHDLRTPLTAIVAAAEPLAGEGLSPEERSELAGDVRVEAGRLGRLIDQLLDLSRLESGAADPRPDWCSLDEVLRASAASTSAGASAFSLRLDELPLVRADAAQLERAFANLLENAARHSGGHEVLVRARRVGERVLVRVVDRGPGIPPAQLERVFEPFYRSGTAETGHRGSGLGLAIARGFLEVNGGRVHAESLPGQGTSFVVELPVGEPAPLAVA